MKICPEIARSRFHIHRALSPSESRLIIAVLLSQTPNLIPDNAKDGYCAFRVLRTIILQNRLYSYKFKTIGAINSLAKTGDSLLP